MVLTISYPLKSQNVSEALDGQPEKNKHYYSKTSGSFSEPINNIAPINKLTPMNMKSGKMVIADRFGMCYRIIELQTASAWTYW